MREKDNMWDAHPRLAPEVDDLISLHPGATEAWLYKRQSHVLTREDFHDWFDRFRHQYAYKIQVLRRGYPNHYFAADLPARFLLSAASLFHGDSLRILLYLRDNHGPRILRDILENTPGLTIDEDQLRNRLKSLVLDGVVTQLPAPGSTPTTRLRHAYQITGAGTETLGTRAVEQKLPRRGTEAYARGELQVPSKPQTDAACQCHENAGEAAENTAEAG